MKRALLVNPWIYDFAAFDLWLRPLGLLYLSTILKDNGFEVSLIDLLDRSDPDMAALPIKNKKYNTGKFHSEIIDKPASLDFVPRNYSRYGTPPDLFIKKLRKVQPPDIILVTSMMTYWYPGVKDTISAIKEVFPDTKIILGGIYARLIPEHAKRHSGADIIFTSNRMDEFIKMMNIHTGMSSGQNKISGFNSWPDPDYSLYAELPHAAIISSLGCLNKCNYCAAPQLNNKFEYIDWQKTRDMIIKIHETRNTRDFAFYDDALLVLKEKRIIPLLESFIKVGDKLFFHTPNGLHARFIDEKIAQLMFEGGFKTIRLSLETSTVRLQTSSDNKVSNNQYTQAVKALLNAGYKNRELKTYIMVGMPEQKKEDIYSTIDFVFDQGAWPTLTEYSIIPGSYDWDIYKDRYALEQLDPLFHNNSVFCVSSGFITFSELEEMKDYIKKRSGVPQEGS